MMLIHSLQDPRNELEDALWHHYHGLDGLTKQESDRVENVAGTYNRVPGGQKAGSAEERAFVHQIHQLEWRTAVRRAGLEGTVAEDLTQNVLAKALDGDRASIAYLELLENDIFLVQRFNRTRQPHVLSKLVWPLEWLLSRALGRTQGLDADTRRSLAEDVIVHFGCRGEQRVARDNRLRSRLNYPPHRDGVCVKCGSVNVTRHRRVYGRVTGGLVRRTSYQAATDTTFYVKLGSFDVFVCRTCGIKRVARGVVIALLLAVAGLALAAGLWSVSAAGGAGILVRLAAIVAGLGGVLLGVGVAMSEGTTAQIEETGPPPEIGVPVNIWTEAQAGRLFKS